MQANKKILSFLILSVLIFPLTGCLSSKKSAETTLEPNPVSQNSPAPEPMSSKRFQDVAGPQAQTAVDSALELSKKNTELFEQVMVLRQKNQGIIAENRQLKDLIAVLRPELEQTEKNLDDAESLLIDMQIELNNWKTDILGYRDEMRNANIAQIKILLKIAKAMGVEVMPEQQKDEELTEAPTTGEPNE